MGKKNTLPPCNINDVSPEIIRKFLSTDWRHTYTLGISLYWAIIGWIVSYIIGRFAVLRFLHIEPTHDHLELLMTLCAAISIVLFMRTTFDERAWFPILGIIVGAAIDVGIFYILAYFADNEAVLIHYFTWAYRILGVIYVILFIANQIRSAVIDKRIQKLENEYGLQNFWRTHRYEIRKINSQQPF